MASVTEDSLSSDQHFGRFARRQRMHDRAELARREVVPEPVAAAQDAVADLEPVDVLLRNRWVLEGAETAGQQVRLRMVVGLFLGDLTLVDEAK